MPTIYDRREEVSRSSYKRSSSELCFVENLRMSILVPKLKLRLLENNFEEF